MKRILVLTFSLLLGLCTVHAQQQFATLLHGDSISVYYGTNALNAAHNAAVNGDIITLSSGVFNKREITKAITIRGAGMFGTDTVSGTNGTVITGGNWGINIPQDSIYHLTMEGVYCPDLIYVTNAYNPQFTKCYLADINATTNDRTMMNALFVNCILGFYGARLPITVYNSVITSNLPGGDVYAYNCIMGDVHSMDHIRDLHNCIFKRFSGNSYNYLHAYNCIEIHSTQSSAYEAIFKYYRYNTVDYNNPISFELQDSIATTVLGSDGTQVGIYGGQFPFNPRVLNYRANVASQSRPEGKLEVGIQPVNE